jgi:erythromycin esterase
MNYGVRSRGLDFRIVLLAVTCGLLTACGGGDSVSTPPTQNPPPQESEPTAFEVMVSELDEALHPIESTDPMSSLSDLDPLARVAQARVIGMGEAAHGGREFFHLKHKIFRWLVEEHGTTVFAIEGSVPEGIYLDRYVQSGEGDLEAIMLEHMQYWPWYTEEVRDLIQWMTDYNASNPEAVPLRYVGVDCGSLSHQPDLIVEYIADTAPEFVGDTEALVDPYRGDFWETRERYEEMSQGEFEDDQAELDAFRAWLVDEKAALVEASSLAEYRLALYVHDSLMAGHRYWFKVFHAEALASDIFRDRCMADNVHRLEELLGDGVRVAYWGHNFHVSSRQRDGGIPYAGHHLRQEMGSEYKSIGFSFSRGEVLAMGAEGLTVYELPLPPREGSVAELFHAASESNFILDLGALPASELLDWLREPRYTRMLGSVVPGAFPLYWQERLAERYDAIIHVDETTATVPLPVP